jgi:hypothetical protein
MAGPAAPRAAGDPENVHMRPHFTALPGTASVQLGTAADPGQAPAAAPLLQKRTQSRFLPIVAQ